MDRITWNPETLLNIASWLRKASMALDDCSDMLHLAYRDELEMFSGENTPFSNQLLTQTHSSIQKTRLAAERTLGLAHAISNILDRIQTVEQDIQHMCEDIPVSEGHTSFTPRPNGYVPHPFPPTVIILRQNTRFGDITPDWLSQAADHAIWR